MSETDRVLLLRTCGPEGRAYGGFCWPLTVGAEVVAPDWDPAPECGGGLHGLLWGEGSAGYLSEHPDAVWMVVEAAATDVVDIDRKVKAPRCTIRYVGDRDGAVAYLLVHGAADKAVCFAQKQGGDRSTLTGGDDSTLTGGDRSTLTGGHGSTLLFRWWGGSDCRWRQRLVEVGEDGIEPGVAYRCRDGAIEKVTP